jgi:hypothetical protein
LKSEVEVAIGYHWDFKSEVEVPCSTLMTLSLKLKFIPEGTNFHALVVIVHILDVVLCDSNETERNQKGREIYLLLPSLVGEPTKYKIY